MPDCRSHYAVLAAAVAVTGAALAGVTPAGAHPIHSATTTPVIKVTVTNHAVRFLARWR
jgi:hypothetical protein